MHPSWNPLNLLRRVERARSIDVTCPASRHTALIARGLLSKGYPMLAEDPEHCAVSMLATVEALWKARAQIDRLKSRTRRNT